ncbi:MAG: GNAT family N-acetyltransferase [Saprospiraceae bacterium]|nr:GNAT family N-acetyltransferase [Saprospiraceae bacterium]
MKKSGAESSPRIRPANTRDATGISELILGLLGFLLEDDARSEAEAFLETLTPAATRERISSASFRYYVATDDSGISGVIGLRDNTHVYHLFVRPDCHRQGIAHSLWKYALGKTDARVITVNSSMVAVPVYERFGFEQSEPVRRENGLVFMPMEYARK